MRILCVEEILQSHREKLVLTPSFDLFGGYNDNKNNNNNNNM